MWFYKSKQGASVCRNGKFAWPWWTIQILQTSQLHVFLLIWLECISQGSRVRPIWSHVHPNFSRVRLTKFPGRTGASSHSRKEEKKSIRDSETLVQQKTPPLGLYRGLNQSEIVKGGPPLWLAVVQISLYVCVRVDKCVTCAAAVRQRERGE